MQFFYLKYYTSDLNIIFFKKKFFLIQTRFKINYRYHISFMYNDLLIFCLGQRSVISANFSSFTKKNRYITLNYFVLYFLSSIINFYEGGDCLFFYKNINFFHISFLENFFKLCYFFNIFDINIVFNYNNVLKYNKYIKKVKTIKKFKKKINFKLFTLQYKNTYV